MLLHLLVSVSVIGSILSDNGVVRCVKNKPRRDQSIVPDGVFEKILYLILRALSQAAQKRAYIFIQLRLEISSYGGMSFLEYKSD